YVVVGRKHSAQEILVIGLQYGLGDPIRHLPLAFYRAIFRQFQFLIVVVGEEERPGELHDTHAAIVEVAAGATGNFHQPDGEGGRIFQNIFVAVGVDSFKILPLHDDLRRVRRRRRSRGRELDHAAFVLAVTGYLAIGHPEFPLLAELRREADVDGLAAVDRHGDELEFLSAYGSCTDAEVDARQTGMDSDFVA